MRFEYDLSSEECVALLNAITGEATLLKFKDSLNKFINDYSINQYIDNVLIEFYKQYSGQFKYVGSGIIDNNIICEFVHDITGQHLQVYLENRELKIYER